MPRSLEIWIVLKHQFLEAKQLGHVHKMRQLCTELIQTKLGLDVTTSGTYRSICNSSRLRKREFQNILNLLEKNGFPLNYINRQIQHFLAEKHSKNLEQT